MTHKNTKRATRRHGRGGPGLVLLVLLALAGTAAAVGGAAGQAPPAAQDGSSSTEAPAGRLLGRVIASGSGEPVAHADVVTGSGASTITDLNGRFLFRALPHGPVDVSVQALGYASKTVTGVVVPANDVGHVDIALERQAIEMGTIRVTAAREEGSTAYLMDERRTADALVEAVGAQEIGRRPDSDAADVAQRLTGVTVTDGKYVFIRGLGERYSQTTLNGSSLPSPEPEREVVPLDLFPSAFLESLQTQKSYTPDLAADFSGGTVKIRTKDFPSHFAGRFGVSTSANSESQFQGGYLHYGGGSTDWLGLDDGTRGQPATLREVLGDVRSGERLPTDPAERVAIGNALRSQDHGFTPGVGSTPLNRGFDLSMGGRLGLSELSELGYLFAGTYSDRYSIRDGEVERKWRADAFQDATAELATPNVDYVFDRGVRNVTWGTVGNIAYKPTPDHQITLKTTVNLSTDDEARVYVGQNREDIGGQVRSERARYVERLMGWGQLSGEHLAPFDSRLEWRITGARASRDEPLLRETIYLHNSQSDQYLLLDFTESARYFFSELVDDELSAEVDWRLPFAFLGSDGAVKVGAAYRLRERGFGARRLNWRFLGSSIADLDSALAAGEVVAGSPSSPDEFVIDEVVEPGDVYDVTDERAAGYAMLELPVTSRLQAVVGARVERYNLGLMSRGSALQDLGQTDVAPALNLTYSVTDQIKLRGAVSRTLDRPEFRELAPFQFTEATSLRQLVGNPQLEPAEITSADVRADWFWGPSELVSFGGFFKAMESPIEQVYIAAASSAYSFQNARSATVWGIEADVQLGLGRLADPLEDLSVQANYSRIWSGVHVKAEGIFQPTNLERPLEGQASYVLNTGLSYGGGSGIEAGVFFNRFGERLTAAGGSGLPDIYEQPRDVLDASVGVPIRHGVRVKVKGTNLLDAEHRFLQSANGYTRTQRSYDTGRTLSVGLSWEF